MINQPNLDCIRDHHMSEVFVGDRLVNDANDVRAGLFVFACLVLAYHCHEGTNPRLFDKAVRTVIKQRSCRKPPGPSRPPGRSSLDEGAIAADKIFTTPMGNDANPCRKSIAARASRGGNIDV